MPGPSPLPIVGPRPGKDTPGADGNIVQTPTSLLGAAARLPARQPRALRPTLLIAIALGLLSLPTLTGLPLAPLSGCARWIALAVALELMSLLGFAVVFKLVFCARLSWRRGFRAALRGLGASTVLPAGGLVGPAIGVYSPRSSAPPLARVARSAVAFVLLTNAPSVAMLAALGLAIRVGLVAGPRDAALTLLPGGVALTVLAAGFLVGGRGGARTATGSRSPRRLVRAFAAALSSLRDGVSEARALVLGGDWKLLGALAYYAFDNAVLWAAFHAYGRTPAPAVIAMGYLVGSLGATLPIPAGIGAAEGGLIGALVLYGAPAAPAAAAVLLYRGVSLLIAVPLGTLGWAPQPLAKLLRLPGRFRSGTPEHARGDASGGRSSRDEAPSSGAAAEMRHGLLGAERRDPARGRTGKTVLAALLAMTIALANRGRSQPRDGSERRARARRRAPDLASRTPCRRVLGAHSGPRPTGEPHPIAVDLATPTWTAI
jgi:uncharacterized membrane protein YbhN (UPF0104 family)